MVDNLSKKMSELKPVIGTWNTLGSPLVTEVIASSGVDFIIIDFEHGPFSIEKTSDYVNACNLYNCSSIVRIPKNSRWIALQALDLGAKGIMIPNVQNKEYVNKLIKIIKYPPIGSRGYSPFTKAGRFNESDTEYQKKSNKNISIIIIEDKIGLNNIDEILEVESVDIVYFGAYDLSNSLGLSGDIKNPKFLEIIKKNVLKVLKSKKYAGGFVPKNIDQVNMIRDIGINFITYNIDSFLIYDSFKKVMDWFNSNKK